MNGLEEFKVNEFINLKLEGGNTIIYIAGERFQQCKFLLINIPESNANGGFESIDEASEWLGKALESLNENPEELEWYYKIPPETEFWGHCSNLQVWVEQNYDSRLLKSNLSFPLLKKLVTVGDFKAQAVFKEEIAKRLIKGSDSVVAFLYEEGYFQYLGKEELWSIVDPTLEELRGKNYDVPFWNYKYDLPLDVLRMLIEMGDKPALQLLKEVILEILRLGNFKAIEMLENGGYINYLSRTEFWSAFGQDGEVLNKLEEQIKQFIIESISSSAVILLKKNMQEKKRENYSYFKLSNYIYQYIGPMLFTYDFENRHVTGIGIWSSETNFYRIKKFPERFSELGFLRVLFLDGLNLQEIPVSIGNLQSLRKLGLSNNQIEHLPKEICKLEYLEYLGLGWNNLRSLPECVHDLINFQHLLLVQNPFDERTLLFLREWKNEKKVFIDISS